MFCQYRLFELCTRVSIFAENQPEDDLYHLQRLDGKKKRAKKQYAEKEKTKGILSLGSSKMKCPLAGVHTQNCPPAETLAIPAKKRGRGHP